MERDGMSGLPDVLAIRALCERYAQAIDAGDAAAFVSVFTSDAHLVSNWRGTDTHFNGREELARVPHGAKELAPTTIHVIGNHIADIHAIRRLVSRIASRTICAPIDRTSP